MSDKNILVLSAGRRVELVQAFIDACSELSLNSKVYCTDMFPELSPACHSSNGYFKAPRVTDDNYIDFLRQLCIDENISLLIPTIDTELLLLAEYSESFKELGIQIIISDSELIKMCRDKRKTAQVFSSLEIDQPEIYQYPKLTYPCFCKPYDGSCSKGAMTINSEEDLTQEIISNEKNMFMELIGSEYCEVTIDAYYDKNGELKCLVPRERIEVRAGEVSKGITRKGALYEYLLERLVTVKGAVGCLTVQVFYNSDSNSVKGLEINPRFGGGFPLSNDVGAKYPEWLLREYFLNQEISFFDGWTEDVLMLRYDAKVLVSGKV